MAAADDMRDDMRDGLSASMGPGRLASQFVDAARLVHMFHCVCAAIGAQVWLEYVPTGANIADQPSRAEFALLLEMGSVDFSRSIEWPDMAPAWTGVFDRVFDAYAPKPTRAERKTRKRVADAIDSERENCVRLASRIEPTPAHGARRCAHPVCCVGTYCAGLSAVLRASRSSPRIVSWLPWGVHAEGVSPSCVFP